MNGGKKPMKHPQSINHWLVFQTESNATECLSYENSLIRFLPAYNQEHIHRFSQILHYYPIQTPTILLGAKDTRLPQFNLAYKYLIEQGYEVIVRPHGGTAIVCNDGVINFSWIRDRSDQTISIDQAYQDFVTWFQWLLEPLSITIETYEMPHSYCPGKYDLILNQAKIGGTAQRRFKNGISTSAYLAINGNQDARSELLMNFYKIGQADASYPQIYKQNMATLSHQINKHISSQTIYNLFLERLDSLPHSFSILDANNPILSTIFKEQQQEFQRRQINYFND